MDAQASEEKQAKDDKWAEGAPGQTSEAETKPDQKEKPGRSHTGTFQDSSDDGPTNLGDARKSAKVCATRCYCIESSIDVCS